MQAETTLELFIDHERQGDYFTVPFTMPPNVESLVLVYRYPRYAESESIIGPGRFNSRREINIIDLGLLDPGGAQVGASGSDKNEIYLSEVRATPGYKAQPLVPGEWQILVGAYKVAPEGVTVTYELSFTQKFLRLLKGDLHTHTLASDGVSSAEELARQARRHGLDFLAITDHNQMVSAEALPQLDGLTLLPGVEWTHYQGHASFIGVDQPYDTSFAANTHEEALARFESARQRGALITVNHPFEPGMGFQFDLDTIPFDCLEIWNGPMRASNLQTVGLWHNLLAAGRKIVACGGSDYHRTTPFIFLGGPTTCIYALSSGPGDILAALRQGHSYIIFASDGPTLELKAGEAILGDSVSWPDVHEIEMNVGGLLAGDILQVVTGQNRESILHAPENGRFSAVYPIPAPGFARIEILRTFLPGLPHLPALISNPVYFDAG